MEKDSSFAKIQQEEIQREQARLDALLPENLSEYTGKMVIIRDKTVIAVGEDAIALIKSGQLKETDLPYVVPHPGPYLMEFQDAA